MSRNSISTNQELRQGEFIQSLNNEYYTILQIDGNLVTYQRSHGAVWATGTVNSYAKRLVLQSDGNLVMFDGAKRVIWESGTNVEPFSHRMRLTISNEGLLLLDNDGENLTTFGNVFKKQTK